MLRKRAASVGVAHLISKSGFSVPKRSASFLLIVSAINGALIVTASASATAPSRIDQFARFASSPTGDPCFPVLHSKRRPCLLRPEYNRCLQACSDICRSHPQRREAERTACTSAYQVRVGDQSSDSQGAGSRNSALAACDCRRGDRIGSSLLRLLTAAYGPEPT